MSRAELLDLARPLGLFMLAAALFVCALCILANEYFKCDGDIGDDEGGKL